MKQKMEKSDGFYAVSGSCIAGDSIGNACSG